MVRQTFSCDADFFFKAAVRVSFFHMIESVYDETAKESDQIVQIQNILSRTLIAWLGIIVLLAVTGIFI